MLRARYVVAVVVTITSLCAVGAQAASIIVRPLGSSVTGMDSVVVASMGGTVQLEVAIDTMGLTLEGYSYDLEITPAVVDSITLAHVAVSGPPALSEDLFGIFNIDDTNDRISNVNQATFAGAGVPAGIYVVDTLSFVVNALPTAGIDVTAFLGLGDSLGIAGGSVTDVTFFSTTVVPEPTTACLLALGLAGLASSRRGARQPD